jgi:putative membrane protein
MKQLHSTERSLLIGHIISMIFGLAGIMLVLPSVRFQAKLAQFEWGPTILSWSMAGGGVIYMLLGTLAVALYAYRTIGKWHWLSFMIPAIAISLSSELLGTSTGFPFGYYRYLSGLGYKIAGLVPFTIPLSWFYVGFSAYIIARAGLETSAMPPWLRHLSAIAFGALCLTSWDFVLDPGMSQAAIPFWVWDRPGVFFGMPYQNFAGWLGTGALFMGVAAILWRVKPLQLPKQDLELPLAIYLTNFAFGTILSWGAGIYPPVFLGVMLGVFPILVLYEAAKQPTITTPELTKLETTKIPVASVGVVRQ